MQRASTTAPPASDSVKLKKEAVSCVRLLTKEEPPPPPLPVEGGETLHAEPPPPA